jgi:hypothetical protein
MSSVRRPVKPDPFRVQVPADAPRYLDKHATYHGRSRLLHGRKRQERGMGSAALGPAPEVSIGRFLSEWRREMRTCGTKPISGQETD